MKNNEVHKETQGHEQKPAEMTTDTDSRGQTNTKVIRHRFQNNYVHSMHEVEKQDQIT